MTRRGHERGDGAPLAQPDPEVPVEGIEDDGEHRAPEDRAGIGPEDPDEGQDTPSTRRGKPCLRTGPTPRARVSWPRLWEGGQPGVRAPGHNGGSAPPIRAFLTTPRGARHGYHRAPVPGRRRRRRHRGQDRRHPRLRDHPRLHRRDHHAPEQQDPARRLPPAAGARPGGDRHRRRGRRGGADPRLDRLVPDGHRPVRALAPGPHLRAAGDMQPVPILGEHYQKWFAGVFG